MKPGFGRHFQRANMTAPVSILQELGMLFREQLRSQFKKKNRRSCKQAWLVQVQMHAWAHVHGQVHV